MKKKELWVILILILVSSLPYLPGVSDEFVFDDVPAVKNNPDVAATSPYNILFHDFWGAELTSKYSHKESNSNHINWKFS